jgi:YD repeat-containing protein
VIAQYALSRFEYLESQQAFRTRMAKGRVLFRNLYGIAFLVTLLGIRSHLSRSPVLGNVLFVAAAGLLLERAVLWRVRAAARYRDVSWVREPIQLRIEESNLLRMSSAGTEEIRWANIMACHETDKVFLLRLGLDDFLTIPKRAFSSGDLFRFNELRQKELIVRTTRQNSDILLLKFAVTWALIGLAALSLFIGYVHNFLIQMPGARRAAISSGINTPVAQKYPPATADELSASGTVDLVPFGNVQNVSIQTLTKDLRKRYGLELRQLPSIPPPSWSWNTVRHQLAAEDLITAMKLAYPRVAKDPAAILIGFTDEDMYIQKLKWNYSFSFRDEERFAVISTAHLSENDDDDDKKPATSETLQKRALKILIRDVGFLYYHLQLSHDYGSIMYENVYDASELDDIGNDYLQSDALVRAELHVEGGDPCFVLRHHSNPERDGPIMGTVTSCSGYYRELNLETTQIDLRSGLLLSQRTDFSTADRNPLELTRVLRTQDAGSRAFGVGGSHSLNIFLTGDKWPFTQMDLVLGHGGRSHFQRSNWGFGYWDARYKSRDAAKSEFAGATIDWAWPGWKLKNGGITYWFPDGDGTARPEQRALAGIQTYDGTQVTLDRDAAGNLLVARSPTGKDLVFKYDRNNRVVEASQKSVGRFLYSYDPTGHLAQVTDADERITEYSYDSAGRMNRITQNGKTICTLDYDSADRVKAETLADGRTYSFRYSVSNHGEVSSIHISDSAGPLRTIQIFGSDYTLDVRPRGE